MPIHYKNIALCTLSAIILASCAPQKKEEVPPPPVEAPAVQPEEVLPSETKGLSLPQQDELKINEDNVMNPFPG